MVTCQSTWRRQGVRVQQNTADTRIPRFSAPLGGGRELYYLVIALLLVLFGLMIKTGWLGDDAYIGFRTIDNLLQGHGLRWNVADRVQVFTFPVWLFVLTISYWITHEIFVTSILLSIVISLVAVIISVWRVSSSAAAAVAGLAALISSKAFVDYTSSGLENSVSYLLIAVFCGCFLRAPLGLKALRRLVLVASLAAFNRLDLMLVFAPALAYAAWLTWSREKVPVTGLLRAAVIYSVPLWAWLVFATIYFGFMFPNTYYAKLYTGIPKGQLLIQGLLYYVNSLNADPATLVILGLASIAAVASEDPRLITAAIGITFYLLYIVKIGGDFMSGRFFSVPFFFAVALLIHLRLRKSTWLALAVLFIGLGLLARNPSVFNNERYATGTVWDFSGVAPNSIFDQRGIADERAAYFPEVGLVTVLKHDRFVPLFAWAHQGMAARAKGRHIVVQRAPGLYGFYAGPAVHILDPYALGDPLLSKLPIVDAKNWRVGHYFRAVPAGYVASLQTGTNSLEDPQVRELYRVIKILTQDPIWSVERFKEIAKMNLGFYSNLIKSIPSQNTETPADLTEYPWPQPNSLNPSGP